MTLPTRSVSIIGLPESGKTTFLAALWHLVQASEIETRLRFGSLREGDFNHLNRIADRWRSALTQERTQTTGLQTVSMNLLDGDGRSLRISFPDVPGEEYRGMWEERRISHRLAEELTAGSLLLMVNGDKVTAPAWAMDYAQLSKRIGTSTPAGQPHMWDPGMSPTQVQLVDILQLLRQPPLDRGPRRLAVMISVWDKAEGEGLSPGQFVDQKLPLLAQYLDANRDGWAWRVYGVSAQGGEYDDSRQSSAAHAEAEELRELELASERIRLIDCNGASHDLTRPLEWLIQ